MTSDMVKISARRYYGRHATGVVVVCIGGPRHFTGATANKDANTFIKNVIKNRNHEPII